MYKTIQRICANVDAHPEVPFRAFLDRVHFRVPLLSGIFPRIRRLNDRRINDCAPLHLLAFCLQYLLHLVEEGLLQTMGMQKLPEFAQGCGVRYLGSLGKVQPQEGLHGVAVVYGILYPFIGELEPYLQHQHTQHHLYLLRGPAALSIREKGAHQFHPFLPWQDGIHLR